MTKVYLSLGSNMGDRQGFLQAAVAKLSQSPANELIKASAYYQTSPVGGVVQDDFINQALLMETDLSATDLLDLIHEIEASLDRKRLVHWGPRTIDIDILFYGDTQLDTKTLSLPHPEVFNRLFVLVPLAEIMPRAFAYYDQVEAAIKHLQVSEQKIERIGN